MSGPGDDDRLDQTQVYIDEYQAACDLAAYEEDDERELEESSGG